jgi:gas vesicle protein
MQSKSRETILKIAVGAVAGLFVLDRLVLSAATAGWKEQGERLTALREKVGRGRQLIEREKSIRARWNDMLRTDLSDDSSAAENDVYQAISRWSRDSRISFTNLTPQWRPREENSESFECRATATGDYASLARLLYEIETDPLPARVDDAEISTRDAQGKQLTLSVRFSFVRIDEKRRAAR